MKNLHTLLLVLAGLLVSSHSIAQGSLAALDAKNGFKRAKFGMPLSSFTGLVHDKNENSGGNRQSYRGPTRDNVLGAAKLEYIEYSFYKGKLDRIVFVVKGKTSCHNVVQAIKLSYGPGKASDLIEGGIKWQGQIVSLILTPMKDEGTDYYSFLMENFTYLDNDYRKPVLKGIMKDL